MAHLPFELSEKDGEVLVPVWVKPRSSKTRLVGVREGALEVAVAAPPVEGAANEALVRFFAGLMNVGRGSVRVARGSSSRTKSIGIRGASATEVADRLTEELARYS